MNTTEDRARAAMRAIDETVNDAPPLRLPQSPAGAPARRFRWRLPQSHAGAPARRFRWRLWVAPLAAAVAVIAIAVALVVVRDSPAGRGGPAVTPGLSSAVPKYYVALKQPNDSPVTSLVVGNTLTGAQVAAIPAPAGSSFAGVSGAADDRTFVVETQPGYLSQENELWQPRTWYLLRLSPGSARPVSMTRLPIPATAAGTVVRALALSPDGSKLALAIQPNWLKDQRAPLYLRLYSVTTGAVLRSWSTTKVSAVFGGPKMLGPDRNSEITWLGNGQTLSFASSWTVGASGQVLNTNVHVQQTIRTLDIARPGNDLIADSRLTWSTVTYPGRFSRAFGCVLADSGPLVAADGKVVVCGAASTFGTQAGDSQNCQTAQPWRQLGFLAYPASAKRTPPQVLGKYASACGGAATVEALWISASGSAVIGYQAFGDQLMPLQNRPDARFGLFSHGKFTPLPYPLISGASFGEMLGNSIAW